MQQKMILWVVTMLLDTITPEVGVKFLRAGIEAVRGFVKESPNTLDDDIVLPICDLADKMLVKFE